MMKKEKFLKRMRNESADWLGNPWNCFHCINKRPMVPDAVNALDPLSFGTFKDMFGVTWRMQEGEPGATPYITEENKLVKDITRWKETVKFPDISDLDWTPYEEIVAQIDREEYLVMSATYNGMFEFSHLVMGFEDSLVAFLEEPEAMYDMLAAYTDWKIEHVKLMIDHLHPDVIHSHDDWGNKRSMFLSPPLWREAIKPHFARLYGYCKERGVLVMHHSDCVNDDVAEDMVELGIDMWQGCIPQNDIPGVVKRTGGKLCILGGIDMPVCDRPDWKEDVIRREVRRAIDEYAGLGCFMPCIENIKAIYPEVGDILDDEMEIYGKIWVENHQ